MSARSKRVAVAPERRPTRRAARALPVHRLDPEAPGLDEETRQRRRALAAMQLMTMDELHEAMVRAGIYTRAGELTARYRAAVPGVRRARG